MTGAHPKIYRIKRATILSVLIFLVCFFVATMSLCFICMVLFADFSVLLTSIVFFFALLLDIYAFYQWSKKMVQKLHVALHSDKLVVKCISKPFYDQANDQEIRLNAIKSYKINDPYNGGSSIKLYLKNGRKFEAGINALENRSEFNEFAQALVDVVNAHNAVCASSDIIKRKFDTRLNILFQK